MGKKAKIGKSRKDKFYRLAKETGYRARSAFKLLQLNRKFEFLQKARVCLDLCAAPGGWLQVAAQHMPVSSLIVGVDLVPIKPVHQNVTTMVNDITTDKCRQDLKKELKTWKVDCVLHDGAPNVGKNWIQDAFSQAELTLQALKLATEFLRKGGWFVTKVFRSADYHALMWIFKQMFKKVHATKPQASRLESAEIFVVCQHYTAPDKIDPKFLDAKHVFKQIDTGPRNTLNLIHPEKIKKRAEGYEEGDYTLHHKLNVSDFIRADNHLELLADTHEIVLDDPKVASHPSTTLEIKECCKDIKVLGKKEIRSLITWRKNLKKALKTYHEEPAEPATEDGSDSEEKEGSDEEENELNKKLADMKSEEVRDLKRKMKKVRKEKAKLQQKMSLNMVIPGDRLDITDDVNLFDLNHIKKKEQLTSVEDGEMMDDMSDDEEIDGALLRKGKQTSTYTRDDSGHLEFESDDDDGEGSDSEDERDDFYDDEAGSGDDYDDEDAENDEDDDETESNPLIMDLDDKDKQKKRKTDMWFGKDVFTNIEDDIDEDLEIETMTENYKKKGGTIKGKSKEVPQTKEQAQTKTRANKDMDSDSGHVSESSDNDSDTDTDSSEDDNYDDRGVVSEPAAKKPRLGQKKDGFEIVPAGDSGLKKTKLDAESLALGAALASSRKRRRDIIDEGFNRYSFNDEGLPDWFVKDESKFMRRQLPVTKEEVQQYKERIKAIDARPIKKVAEAKGRKKRKAAKRLERARKKAEAVTDAIDVTDKEKMQQIKQIYKKAGLLKDKKPEVQYVVAKRASGKRVSRPAGVKGRFKVVDPRMKKDNMREKKNLKSGKKGKKRSRR